jgi:hypothetical protein
MENLITAMLDARVRIHAKSKTRVMVDNRILDGLAFFNYASEQWEFFATYVKNSDLWRYGDKDKAAWVQSLWESYFAEMRSRTSVASDAFNGSNFNTSDFELVTNFHTGKEVVYNVKQRKISDLHPDAFIKSMGKTQRTIVKEHGIRIATFSFNPYNDFTSRIATIEGQEVVEFNCFHAPKWRCDGNGNLDLGLEKKYADNNKPPKLFLDFIQHLIPDVAHRISVCTWIYNAIFDRNETYLCLNGKKGAGKNLLVDLIGKLVGEDYYAKAPIAFLDAGFNSVLDQTRLLLLDEIKVETQVHHNRLKNYINKMQNIEKKGIDADKSVETFVSYVINNNEISDMLLYWDDRRFSVPDITEKRLEDFWTQEQIDQFVAAMDDIEFQRQVGFWIKFHGRAEKLHNFHVIRGARYWKIVHNSLPEWQKVIVEAITAGTYETISVRELKDLYRRRADVSRFPFKAQRIKDFLGSYRLQGRETLGEIHGIGEDAEIIPSEKFRAKSAHSIAQSSTEEECPL